MRQARLASISFVGLVSGGLESVHLHVHINVHETFVQYRLVGWNYCDLEGVCVRGAYEMNGQESMLRCFAVDGEMIKHV